MKIVLLYTPDCWLTQEATNTEGKNMRRIFDMCEQNAAAQKNEELKQKAMEHDMTDLPEVDLGAACQAVEKGAVSAYQKIEGAVVGGYKAIENGVVGGYKKIETGVVKGFTKMTDKIVEKFLTREGETVEEAKQRMNSNVQK